MKRCYGQSLFICVLLPLVCLLVMRGASAAPTPPNTPLLWPRPRQLSGGGVVRLRLPIRVKASSDLAAPAALLQRQLIALFGTDTGHARGGTVVRLSLAPDALTRAEEYAVEPGNRSIALRAHDVQGMFWAVHTLDALLQGAQRTRNTYEEDIPQVHDWPDTPFRSMMIASAWTQNLEDDKRYLDLLARLHITYFALEFGPQVVLDMDPAMAKGARFTKAQARDVIDYGRSLGLKPIAYLELLGHLDRAYEKTPYTLHGGIDIRSDEAYEKFVYPILSEMLDVYGKVEYFHCGMDEAWELFTWLSQSGEDVPALLARHIERIDTFLKARGVKMVIWHDMLLAPGLEKTLGGPIGPANGGPPQNTAAALARIPKDVILDYWYYDSKPAYPALDYLKAQGFTVWASPWETPFSLVRYAGRTGTPTLGTLWDGVPGGLTSPHSNPVTALYAQAAWNAAAAPDVLQPEPALEEAARQATASVLWRRPTLVFPGKTALLLSPSGPKPRVVDGATAQFSGVPLDTTHPVNVEPLPDVTQPLTTPADAASVRLPSGQSLKLDGVNTGRGEDQLILYAAPLTMTATNEYGCEVSVGPDGMVKDVTRGVGNHSVPPGGFILSAHQGASGAKANALLKLQAGDRVSVLASHGQWIGGSAPASLQCRLPDGQTLPIDGTNRDRGPNELILYNPTQENDHTGTNEYGVEVVIRDGKVASVRPSAGDSPIPADGYVLSAHQGTPSAAAIALEKLRPGDAVQLLITKGGPPQDVDPLLAARAIRLPVQARCSAFYLAMNTGRSSAPGSPLGAWIVRYEDGTEDRIPVRYGREAIPAAGEYLPDRLDDPVWMIQQATLRCLVREWINPHPERLVRELTFLPSIAILDTGVSLVAATGATD